MLAVHFSEIIFGKNGAAGKHQHARCESGSVHLMTSIKLVPVCGITGGTQAYSGVISFPSSVPRKQKPLCIQHHL